MSTLSQAQSPAKNPSDLLAEQVTTLKAIHETRIIQSPTLEHLTGDVATLKIAFDEMDNQRVVDVTNVRLPWGR